MKKFLEYCKIIFRRTTKLVNIAGRILSLLFFVILVAGVIYYFMKPDLPPQEIRDLLYEFIPNGVERLENLIPEEVFEFIEIVPYNEIENQISTIEQLTGSNIK